MKKDEIKMKKKTNISHSSINIRNNTPNISHFSNEKDTAKYFESRFDDKPERELVWKHLSNFIQKWVPKNSTVLDLGAGYGGFINNIKAKKKYANDINKNISKYVDKDVISHVGSCDNLSDFKSESVDVVFASNLFEHLEKPVFYKTLREVRRILKKNGVLIILQPNFKYCYKEFYDDYTHVLPMTHLSMMDVLKLEDYKIEKCIPRLVPFSMKGTLPKIPGLDKLYFFLPLYLRFPIRPYAGAFFIVAKK